MSRSPSSLRPLLCLLALGTLSLRAQTPKPISGFYGGDTLQLVISPDGSFRGAFYDETGAGQFSCGFLIRSTTPPTRDGLYTITSWWPEKELGRPVDDEIVNGTLRVTPTGLTLQLPKQAHGGCWNVNADLDQGNPVDLDRDKAEPTWQSLRVVKSKRVSLRPQPIASAPARPYIVQGNVVIVTATRGSWLHVEYHAYVADKTFTGWLQDSDLLPPL